MGPEKLIINRRVHKVSEMSVVSDEHLNQRVKNKEGKTQILWFWAGESGQIFLAGHIWAVKCSHRWQHLWAKVKIKNLL